MTTIEVLGPVSTARAVLPRAMGLSATGDLGAITSGGATAADLGAEPDDPNELRMLVEKRRGAIVQAATQRDLHLQRVGQYDQAIKALAARPRTPTIDANIRRYHVARGLAYGMALRWAKTAALATVLTKNTQARVALLAAAGRITGGHAMILRNAALQIGEHSRQVLDLRGRQVQNFRAATEASKIAVAKSLVAGRVAASHNVRALAARRAPSMTTPLDGADVCDAQLCALAELGLLGEDVTVHVGQQQQAPQPGPPHWEHRGDKFVWIDASGNVGTPPAGKHVLSDAERKAAEDARKWYSPENLARDAAAVAFPPSMLFMNSDVRKAAEDAAKKVANAAKHVLEQGACAIAKNPAVAKAAASAGAAALTGGSGAAAGGAAGGMLSGILGAACPPPPSSAGKGIGLLAVAGGAAILIGKFLI